MRRCARLAPCLRLKISPRLKSTPEAGGTLLDRTTVLFGSNLGNASSHDTKNMPIPGFELAA
ncbi:hypothetical protein [Armatimonas sp.]|uniref:hypothetical protein n=1 Tax=Armatimonas sp. TaxID=1872638 RepID=UPI003751F8B1